MHKTSLLAKQLTKSGILLKTIGV